ncbi:hypothetical protein EWM64_g4109 [Hericium alpestre]|uniref:Peptidase C14 caspase domain-containing protein n=1 Tax=Hericium alpestre TaxID=135208 RepID=A0A4Z0A0D6_9AGAM|nr:hypothetical protein EWM64_g4109 [Hericium alpestre]
MASRLFSLIIGIDQYKSGDVWDLTSCVDDAMNIKRWLMNDLNVPRSHICLLLDEKASKRSIEDKFMSHLVSNPAIEPGDALLIYFAGHGSSVVAPDGWCNNDALHTQMLCTYDHGTKGKNCRVSGITDWSMHAMLANLCEAKGDNITLILDCCFSPARSRINTITRRSTRWTPTTKVTSDDLYAGLWPGALGRKLPHDGYGFYQKSPTTHVTLLACSQGERAMEDKEGGHFTVAFLKAKNSMPFHRTSYGQLASQLSAVQETTQHAVCVGRNWKRPIFGGAPFVSDARYVSAVRSEKHIRIDAGAIHGIVEGTVFSMHEHNYLGSLNPVLATLHAFEVHPTWCLARSKFPLQHVLDAGWARITQWNNKAPFRVHLKKTCSSFMQWWKLRSKLPSRSHVGQTIGGLSIQRVGRASQAHISVKPHDQHMSIERRDTIAENGPPVIHVPTNDPSADARAIDAAARFHLHLHRKNSLGPLRDDVSMKLFRLDEDTWTTVGDDLLQDGKATVTHEKGAIFAVSLDNKSDVDLWPYLFWMDTNGYVISPVYHPHPFSLKPPLPGKSQLLIGTGTAGSEALSFHLDDGVAANTGFLKLFLSNTYVPMNIVEQGPSPVVNPAGANRDSVTQFGSEETVTPTHLVKEMWDSITSCVTIVRRQ